MTQHDTTSPIPRTIGQAAEALQAGTLTAQALTRACLEVMSESAASLNAVTCTLTDQALQQAERLDLERSEGHIRGPLHGIPIVVKDNIDMAGVPSTVGSAACIDNIATDDAGIVQGLKRAGAIIIAKTNMNEFAAGLCGRNRHFGDVRNPWGKARSAGGSSSGTAAAVAAGLCMGGIGTDTGGSIRVPAAWCGLVGLRPTMGLVPSQGIFPRATSLDTAGPIGRSAQDVAWLLDALTLKDVPAAPHPPHRASGSYAANLSAGVHGLKIGIDRGFVASDVDAETLGLLDRSLTQFGQLGADVAEIDVPALRSELDYSDLMRGVLLYEFGTAIEPFRLKNPGFTDRVGPIVQRELQECTRISRSDYEQLTGTRKDFAASLRRVFEQVDALVMPAMPMPALSLDADDAEFQQGRRFMLPFSFAGLPSLVLPIGLSEDGLPIGAQLVADFHQEATLLRIAAAYEVVNPLPQSAAVCAFAGA